MTIPTTKESRPTSVDLDELAPLEPVTRAVMGGRGGGLGQERDF